jgi:hypothetical protein
MGFPCNGGLPKLLGSGDRAQEGALCMHSLSEPDALV